MNIFQRQAQQNESEGFANVIPKANPEPIAQQPANTNTMQSTKVLQNPTEAYSPPPMINNPVNKPISQPAAPATQGNIFQQVANKEQSKKADGFDFLSTARDVLEQASTKLASGFAGAYGNILDAFGAQGKEYNQQSPAQIEKNKSEFQILDKMNRGEIPSFAELMSLSSDDVLPSISRLPSSQEIEQGIESRTGIGEGKTPAGRISGRGANFLGEAAALGGGARALAGSGVSGLAGQSVREAGGPEWAATAIDILGPLAPTVITKTLAPLSKTGKDIVNAGRRVGLSESSIAPLLQSEGKAAVIAPVARKGTRTKNVFGKIKEQLGDSYNSIKSNPEAKKALSNSDQIGLRKKFADIRNDLSKTLAPSPDKQAALDYIEKSLDTLRNANITPEYMVNFWQDINKSVKWNSINGGKKALAQLKEPIAESLKKVSPGLAQDFEMTNKLYSKYAQISKKLKPDLVDSFVNKGELLAFVPSAYALVQGNPLGLASLGTEMSVRILGREMLINPYFQTIAGKLVNNFNAGSVKAIQGTVKQVQEYMQRKHPNEDWSFLTKELKDED